MEKRALKIDRYTDLYYVTEDGQVFSVRSQRFLKPFINKDGYILYRLNPHREHHTDGKSFMSHRLVAMHWIGDPPTRWHTDCHHKDHDRAHNHYSNLEWLTHSENILRSYRETDRVGPKAGKTFGPHSPETIALMRAAKEKAVYAEIDGERKEYGSIQDMLGDLGIYRKAFNRSVNTGTPYKGMSFGYINN